jgi:hypothetical protein
VNKYKIKKGIILQKLKGSLVIFDSEKSLLYNLNETASYIFSQLKRGLSEEEVSDLMSKRYEVAKIQAQNDVKALVVQLLRKKIVDKLKK